MSNKNLYDFFRSRFPSDMGKVFLEHDRGTISFEELDIGSAKMVSVLRRRSVKKGDRVMVQVEKSPEAVLLYLACLRAGAIFVPLNTAYTDTEVDYFIEDAKPKVFICDPKVSLSGKVPSIFTLNDQGKGSLIDSFNVAQPFESLEDVDSDEIVAMLYTSGTTGRSKGAMITTENLSSNALVLHKYWGFETGDVLLHALPIYHAHGLFVALHCALLNGSKILFHKNFNVDDVIKDIPNATVMMGVPTFYVRLLAHAKFNKNLVKNMRLFIAGSAPLLAETFLDFEERTSHRVLERYGMTEALMITSNPYNGERIAGSVGFPLPGVAARIADDKGQEISRGDIGVLEIKGPNVFSGYWNMPEKTAEEFRDDGFFITGDIAVMDDNDRICIVGRAKDMIISGGYNVYPKEVEICIDEIPQVKESAVFGVPHMDFGEGVTAVVVLNKGATVDSDILRQNLAEKLAKFKQPKSIYFINELPRNTMGKVQKNILREKYAQAYK